MKNILHISQSWFIRARRNGRGRKTVSYSEYRCSPACFFVPPPFPLPSLQILRSCPALPEKALFLQMYFPSCPSFPDSNCNRSILSLVTSPILLFKLSLLFQKILSSRHTAGRLGAYSYSFLSVSGFQRENRPEMKHFFIQLKLFAVIAADTHRVILINFV